MGALYKGVIITAGISALVFIPVMHWMVDEIPVDALDVAGAGSTSARSSASSSRRS